MNKYIIGFLIGILIIIYFLIKYENESFINLSKENIVLTSIINDKFTIIEGDANKVLLISFPTRIVPSIIYFNFDNTTQETYYYIYNNGKIMSCINDELYFNETDVEIIASPNYSSNYKLYKTSDNKLYFLKNNTMMYLTARNKNYTKRLEITTDTKHALLWEI